MNTPKPPKRNRYPFDKMKNGDYRKIKFDELFDAKKARLAAHSLGCRTGKKFVTHTGFNKNNGTIDLEIWRVV